MSAHSEWQFANRVQKKSVVISFALHSCSTILRQAMASVCYAGLLAVLCQRVRTTLRYSLLAGSCFSSCWWLVDLWGPTADLPEPFVMETFCSIKLPHTDGRCPQTTLQHKKTAKKANHFTVCLKFQPRLSYRLSPKEEQMYYFLDLKRCSSEAFNCSYNDERKRFELWLGSIYICCGSILSLV